MKLTKEQIIKMLPGQTMTVRCETASELDSTYQTALQGRKKSDYGIAISRSSKTMSVTISVCGE